MTVECSETLREQRGAGAGLCALCLFPGVWCGYSLGPTVVQKVLRICLFVCFVLQLGGLRAHSGSFTRGAHETGPVIDEMVSWERAQRLGDLG